MKLNEEQIKAIDLVLEQSGIVYIDYKYEILDHIATDIEEVMETHSFTFESAFKIILKKWQPKLKKSAGATFGYIWELPAILEQKAKKLYWRKIILLTVSSFVLMMVLLYAREYLAKITETICYLLACLLLIQAIGYFKIWKSSQKTTYGFLYKQQYLAMLFLYFNALFLLNINDNLLSKPLLEVSWILLMIAILIISPIINLKFYKYHFEQLRKFNKLV